MSSMKQDKKEKEDDCIVSMHSSWGLSTPSSPGVPAPVVATARGESEPLLTLRMIYSDMQPIEVRTSHTVAALLLGPGSRAENFMFDNGVKQTNGVAVLWGLWYFGAILGGLVVAQLLPKSFVWASLLMLPLPIVTVALLSTDLLAEVVYGLDLYIIYILQFALFVDGIFYCNADHRIVFWVCYLPTMVASGLVDAYPAKYRAFFAKLFFSASLVILIIWNCLMYFKWNAFGTTFKLSNISFNLHHVSDQATLGVFYCRHLYVSTFRADYFVMIKSDVLTGHQEIAVHSKKTAEGKDISYGVIQDDPHRASSVRMQPDRVIEHDISKV